MERKITIEEQTIYQEDYQMRMLKVCSLDGFLKVNGRGVDHSSFYDYDVSGKVSMKAMYERGKVGAEDLRSFLLQFKAAIREAEKYLLDIHRILLSPEHIFCDEGRYYFCYYPLAQQDLWEKFHELTEYFVKHADYDDTEGIRMVFLLHKGTMEENYSLEKLAAECLQSPKEEKKTKGSRSERIREIFGDEDVPEESGETTYDRETYDWITRQELGSSIMRETDNLWTPMKRFLNKQKKQKWGDWDGLHIEEEEL